MTLCRRLDVVHWPIMNTSPLCLSGVGLILLTVGFIVILCASCVQNSGDAAGTGGTLPADLPQIAVSESATPLADGWLPQDAWASVAPLAFRFLNGSNDVPQAPTLARVVTRDGLLLMRMECQEPDMAHLVYTSIGHDSSTIWRDDTVEVYLQPGQHAPIYHLAMNPGGGRFDAVTLAGGAEDVSWDPPLRVRTFMNSNRWTTELAIPLQAFASADADFSPTAIWRGNFVRVRQGREAAFAEDTGWRATGFSHAANPEHFGRICLQSLQRQLPIASATLPTAGDLSHALPNPAQLADLLRGKFARPAAILGNASADTAVIHLRPLSTTYVGAYEPTEVRIQRESDAFIITARCAEHTPPLDLPTPPPALWQQDCIEVFLAPGRKESLDYLHVVASSQGKLAVTRGVKETTVAGVEVVTSRDADSWTLTLRIADSALHLTGQQLPSLWGLNVSRNRCARGGAAAQATVWSRFLWSAHEPSTFGTLWLAAGNVSPDLGSPASFTDAIRRGHELATQLEVGAAAAAATQPFGINPDVFGDAERQQLDPPSMVLRYLNACRQRVFAARDQAWAQIRSADDIPRFKANLRAAFLRSIGGLPQTRGPLNPRLSVVFENDEIRIERLVYFSRPGFPVTANLFVPKCLPARRLPVVVRIEGHDTPGRFVALRFSEDLARSGYMVMNIDVTGKGERIYTCNGLGSRTPTSNDYAEGAGLTLTGSNLAAYMIWDVMRGLDYLQTRDEADMHRVVLTGDSGGGTMTEYVTALEDRLFAAAPVSSGSSGRTEAGGNYDSEQVLANDIASGLDIEGMAIMASPRPYCVICEATPDVRERTEKSFEVARRFYALQGAAERLKYVPTRGPHGYGKGHVDAFRRWLDQVMPADADGPRPKGKMSYDRASCSASLTGRAFFSRELAGCQTLFSLNAARATLDSAFDDTVATPAAALARAATIRAALASTFGLPQGGCDALAVESRGAQPAAGAVIETIVLTTDEGVVVPALLLSPPEDASVVAVRRPAVLWLSSRGKHGVLELRADAIKQLLAAKVRVLIPDVRGIGESASDTDDTFMGDQTSLSGLGIQVGRLLIGQRVKDILCCISYLRTRSDIAPDRIALLGDSASQVNPPLIRQPRLSTDIGLEPLTQAESLGPVLALLAADLDPRIASCATVGLPSSYADMCRTPYFQHSFTVFVPGILLTCDIPDLCATVAPRPLWVAASVNAMNQRLDQIGDPVQPFRRALHGYNLAGVPGQLTVSPDADIQAIVGKMGRQLTH